MPTVFIPALLKELAEGAETVEIEGSTVREVVENLEAKFPGIRQRLCQGEELRSGLTVAVEGKVSPLGLMKKVSENSEVHFLPAIGGG